MEKIIRCLMIATTVFCSSISVAETEEVYVYGTPVTYEYMPFDKWVKQEMSLVGGAHAQVYGSAYSNYRAGLAKTAYCAQIHHNRNLCVENVQGAHTQLIQQCISDRANYTVTAELGANAQVLNGSVSVTIEASNKSDCMELSHAYRDQAVAKCDSNLSGLKVQTAKQGFCQ
jgi:hypothetical protein